MVIENNISMKVGTAPRPSKDQIFKHHGWE